MSACDECPNSAEWLVYAAYPLALEGDPHPRVAHYPGAMIRACSAHLAERLACDRASFGATTHYLVTPVPSPVSVNADTTEEDA